MVMVSIDGSIALVVAIISIGFGFVIFRELRRHYKEAGRQEEAEECKTLVKNAVINTEKDCLGALINLKKWFELFPREQYFDVIKILPSDIVILIEHGFGIPVFGRPAPRIIQVSIKELPEGITEKDWIKANFQGGKLTVEIQRIR